jgi:SAM-dependent methyltransferase
MKYILEALKEETGNEYEILNLGCGTDFTGTVRVDMYPSEATNLLADDGIGLSFRDKSFDFVLSRCLMEHLGNPFYFLQECKRVVKDNGFVIVETDNAYYWRWIAGVSHTHDKYKGRGPQDKHYSLFLPVHMINFFEKAGLELVMLRMSDRTSEGFLPKKKIDRILAIIGLKKIAYPNIVAVGRKP